ncbi:MAG: nitrogen fixation protein NifM [gamma proteobacterium symbiont of Bathyaustriella thionipta]|nr:nitrogen fixation protein NifM [gamma proteobacterium symbiont of Bathyaustriella thionipta]
MAQQNIQNHNPAFQYHLLRSALECYSCNPDELDEKQLHQAQQRARKSYELESMVLSSTEARDILIPNEQIENALSEITGRYDSEEDFLDDLRRNALDHNALHFALHRELLFDAVMQRVGTRAADISDIDMRLFYELHNERFQSPEIRTARHILVTINPDFAENTREAALARIQEAAQRLKGKANRFHNVARRYSECPTAMEGGKLGEIRRGMLYPEVDACLFDLQEGEISDVVESEMGFHILLCEKIKPGKRLPYRRAAPKIRELLMQRRRRNCQKTWLAELESQS